MAKSTKRREWTKDDVRELKTLARQKTPVARSRSRLNGHLTPRRRRLFHSVCPWIHADSLLLYSRMTCSVLAACACPLFSSSLPEAASESFRTLVDATDDLRLACLKKQNGERSATSLAY
jgi:hypothetical protein